MPVQGTLVGTPPVRFTVLVEVGELVDFRMLIAAVIPVHNIHLSLAEATRKCDLRRRRQIHILEQQELIVEKSVIDF